MAGLAKAAPHIGAYYELLSVCREMHSSVNYGGMALELRQVGEMSDTEGGLLDTPFCFVSHEHFGDNICLTPIAPFTSPPGWEAELTQRAHKSWLAFRQVAEAAGKYIPTSIRRKLPNQPTDPLTIWCEILIACRPANYRVPNGYIGKGIPLSLSPFLDSAEVIELCGLLTNEPKLPVSARPQWDESTEARNKWVYEESLKAIPYKAIIAGVSKNSEWEPLNSIPSVKRAAKAYADRYDLAHPPARQSGRPTKRKPSSKK